MEHSENQGRRYAPRFPGCGAIVVRGSKYCPQCGGRLDGLTVDYSQMRVESSRVCEPDESDLMDSASVDEFDRRLGEAHAARFALITVSTPILAFILLVGGLTEHRTDMLIAGVIFLILTVPVIYAAIKYFGHGSGGREKDRWNPPPRFSRRL